MRKVLLATTALGMGAGVALAQDAMMDMAPSIALSGDAEMGVAGEKDKSVRFHTDVNVKFTLSGMTDGGVAFGSAIELAESGDGSAAVDDDDNHGGIAIFMEDADGFGKLTMGDANGAIAAVVTDARGAGGGAIRDDHEHAGSSGNDGLDTKHDGQILLWERGIGSGFSLAASVELHDHDDNDPSNDPIVGFGGKYSVGMGMGTLGLGLGYQMGSFDHVVNEDRKDGTKTAKVLLWGDAGDPIQDTGRKWSDAGKPTFDGREVEATVIGGSVSMDFTGGGDGIVVIADAAFSEGDGTHGTGSDRETVDAESTHLGLGLGYTVGAISLGVNVGTNVDETSVDTDLSSATAGLRTLEKTSSGVGFAASYDLGGGAEIQFGVGSSETEYDWNVQGNTVEQNGGGTAGWDHSTDTNKWSLGVKFAF